MKFLRSGRERGIRTPGGVTLNGFQDRRFQPLSHLPRKERQSKEKTIKKLVKQKLNKIANKIWRRHSESNRGMEALQASALPLGYVATC